MRLKGSRRSFWFVRVIIVLWLIISVFILFSLSKIDAIVHGELYNYGLQFSSLWASQYWLFLRLIYLSLGLPITLSAVFLISDLFKNYSLKQAINDQNLKGNMVSCSNCRKFFSRPLVMIDFSMEKAKLMNVCPYCSHILGSVEEDKSKDGIDVIDFDKKLVH